MASAESAVARGSLLGLGLTSANVVRVVAVVVVAVAAMMLQRTALDPTKAYRQAVGPSPWQPPGWMFGVVWAIVYTSYALTWLWFASVLRSSRAVDVVFGAGLALNISWAVVLAAAATGNVDPIVAHNISTAILVLLAVFAAGILAWCFRIVAPAAQNTPMKAITTLGFGLYFVWMCIATALSLTSLKL